MFGNDKNNRSAWEFPVNVAEVIEGCQSQHRYHVERFEYWQAEVERCRAELRASGLNLEDEPITGGYRSRVVIDEKLEARWREATAKVIAHDERAKEYARFDTALGLLDGRKPLMLTIDDIAFFDIGETSENAG